MKNNYLITIILVLVFTGIGFYAGMRYQASKRPDFSQTGRLGRQGQLGNRTGARQVMGEILSKDDKSFTVKLTDGSSKIVFFSESTTINKSSQATKADLKTGGCLRTGKFRW